MTITSKKPKRETATIVVTLATFRRLRLLGKMGETFETVIVRLLDNFVTKEKK